MLRQNKKCSSRSNSYLLKKGETLRKPFFIGTRKSHNANIKNKVEKTK